MSVPTHIKASIIWNSQMKWMHMAAIFLDYNVSQELSRGEPKMAAKEARLTDIQHGFC